MQTQQTQQQQVICIFMRSFNYGYSSIANCWELQAICTTQQKADETVAALAVTHKLQVDDFMQLQYNVQ